LDFYRDTASIYYQKKNLRLRWFLRDSLSLIFGVTENERGYHNKETGNEMAGRPACVSVAYNTWIQKIGVSASTAISVAI
jgi:hypothetical protein